MSPVDLTPGRVKEAPEDPERAPFVIVPMGCHIEAHHLEVPGMNAAGGSQDADGNEIAHHIELCAVRFGTAMGDISVALPWEAWDQLAKGVISIVADRARKEKRIERA